MWGRNMKTEIVRVQEDIMIHREEDRMLGWEETVDFLRSAWDVQGLEPREVVEIWSEGWSSWKRRHR